MLDYRNILRVASEPHKSMRTIELELHSSHLLDATEKEFTDWANTVGPSTTAVVKYFLTSGKEPEHGYKYCASLTKLSDRYGPVRLENACQRLLSFSSTPSIRTLSTILKNGQDRAQEAPEAQKEPTQHGITRGADYFRKGGGSR